MLQHVTDHTPKAALPAPTFVRILLVARPHDFVAFAMIQTGCNCSRGADSSIERMPHPFSTERIDHSRGVADGDEIRRQPVVCQRARHEDSIAHRERVP